MKETKKSRLIAAVTAVIDVIAAGLLWLLCSLPLVTLGAATTALYYTVVKCIRHERGSLMGSFFAAFRREFKISTLLWLIFLGVLLVLGVDAWAIRLMTQDSGVFPIFSRILLLLPLMLFPWVFAFVSRFSNTVGGTLKYCAYLAMRHIGLTLAMAAELVAFGLVVYLMPQIAPLLPGVACLLLSLHIEPVFKAITAEMEAQAEDDWYNE